MTDTPLSPAEPPATPGPDTAPGSDAAKPAASASPVPSRLARRRTWAVWLGAGLAGAALLSSVLLWQKLDHIQEQLARQSADSGSQATEARSLAKQALELARETAARQALSDTRISEVALQRSQLEELMQSLSRSRDENLVVDIESALRLAQQQAQLTGSVEPLLATLKTADQRVGRAAQPRLAGLRRAIARDMDRIRAASVTDTPGLLLKLDELARQVDELPLLNAVALAGPARAAASAAGSASVPWWEHAVHLVQDETRRLLRVSRIDQPEAALVSPEQSFFLRENLKLKLLNARLGLLARQTEAARADLAAAAQAVGKYFDPASRKTQASVALLQQVQGQMKAVELPRVDDTLAALATAAAGR